MIGPTRPSGSDAATSGDWLSRLERAVHIREVTGSNPVSPTIIDPNGSQGLRALFLCSP